jgi:hypothetical protein
MKTNIPNKSGLAVRALARVYCALLETRGKVTISPIQNRYLRLQIIILKKKIMVDYSSQSYLLHCLDDYGAS